MALGVLGEARRLRELLSRTNLCSDVAVCFVAVRRDELTGQLVRAGRQSRVYGGRWDPVEGCYVGSPAIENILVLDCTVDQLEIVESDAILLEISAGRGAGKSEAGCLRAIRFIAERPGERGRMVSPTYPLTQIVRFKLLRLIPAHWLMPGKQGIRKADRMLRFVHGGEVFFASAKNPDSLRSWGGSWEMRDEEQAFSTESCDVGWFCLRDAPDGPHVWTQLTPERGEALDRHRQRATDAKASCVQLRSESNCFIVHDVFDMARDRMDRTRAEVEMDGSWDAIEALEAADVLPKVFAVFSRKVHTWRDRDDIRDVTHDVVVRKLGAMPGFRWEYVAGVDPGSAVPNECTLFKIFEPWRARGPNVWVAWDHVSAKGHCGHLAKILDERGYTRRNTLIVPDVNAKYNNLGNPRAPSQLMRAEGYHVVLGKTNPHVRSSVDDILAKLDPAAGRPTLFFRLPATETLVLNVESVLWNKLGKDFDRSVPNDPVDSMRYPISYFEPASRFAVDDRGVHVLKGDLRVVAAG